MRIINPKNINWIKKFGDNPIRISATNYWDGVHWVLYHFGPHLLRPPIQVHGRLFNVFKDFDNLTDIKIQ